MIKKGFTLMEILVVIIIIGILGTLGFNQYTKIVEKSRGTEAKVMLGQLRSAEISFYREKLTYAALADLDVDAPNYPNCRSTHYFSYFCDSTNGECTAARCSSGGKTPDCVDCGKVMHVNAQGEKQMAPPEIKLSVDGNFTYLYGAVP